MAKEKFEFSDTNLNLLKRLWHFSLKHYIWYVVGAVFFMILSSGGEAYSLSLLKGIFDEAFIAKNKDALAGISIQIIAIFFVKSIALFAHVMIMGMAGIKITRDIQTRMFNHFMDMDYSFFKKTTTGQLLTHFGTDTAAVNQVLQTFFTAFLKDVFTIIGMVVLMVLQSPQLSLIILVLLPAVAVPLSLFGKKVRHLWGKSMKESEGLNSYLFQVFNSMEIVKIYCKETFEKTRLRSMLDTLYKLSLKNLRVTSRSRPTMEFLGGAAMAGTILIGGYQITEGLMTTGEFVTFLSALFGSYRPLKSMSNTFMQLQQPFKNTERMFKVFDTTSDIRDVKNAKDLKVTKGQIEFKGVDFSYNKNEKILKNVNLTIPAGKTVALVGASGGGKSTIMRLLPRFYDLDQGQITIDGQDISQVTQNSLRNNMALVSQDVILFDDTIANNISYGTHKHVSKKMLVEASEKAAAAEFIDALPDKYETIVGEGGSRLSGGQKQRVSIARAILKDAPILLLDEATSALDTKSEKIVQNAFEKLMKGRTTLVIAHRLSTIMNADLICVVNDGEIVEQGTHDELLKKDGTYAKLYYLQFKKEK